MSFFFLRHFVDSVVESSSVFWKKEEKLSRTIFYFSYNRWARSLETKSFVTDVDVRGSRAWYNTVKMAVFTSFVIIATARDDEIHKQPPTVDLHIQMGFFLFLWRSIATPRAILYHDKHRHVAREPRLVVTITQHTHTRTNGNYSRFSAQENPASFRETENPTSLHSQLGQIAGAMQ